MEYHQIVTDPALNAQFVRPVDDLRNDLNWLYAHGFYVVPLRAVMRDQIKAPAGKHPVALTFDDSTVGQFRYRKGGDGSLTIDPNSGVGVLEAMFAAHPDFGRGATFFALPTACFDWPNESDQTPYCGRKLRWLLAHGYEIGDHTVDHADLLNVDDGTFQAEVAGGIAGLKKHAPKATIDLFAMPFGDYPDKVKHVQQRAWLRDGFDYGGTKVRLLGTMMVGAEPAPSPVSSDWEPLYTPRIQMCDCDYGNKTWFALFAQNPAILYTSDGDPNTLTIPNALPPDLDGTFDPTKTSGKRVIRY